MPAAFSRAQVEAVAALANLELDEQEIELFGRQLADILEYATQVQAIDTAGVRRRRAWSPVMRGSADDGRPSLDRAEALANAPDATLRPGCSKCRG